MELKIIVYYALIIFVIITIISIALTILRLIGMALIAAFYIIKSLFKK